MKCQRWVALRFSAKVSRKPRFQEQRKPRIAVAVDGRTPPSCGVNAQVDAVPAVHQHRVDNGPVCRFADDDGLGHAAGWEGLGTDYLERVPQPVRQVLLDTYQKPAAQGGNVPILVDDRVAEIADLHIDAQISRQVADPPCLDRHVDAVPCAHRRGQRAGKLALPVHRGILKCCPQLSHALFSRGKLTAQGLGQPLDQCEALLIEETRHEPVQCILVQSCQHGEIDPGRDPVVGFAGSELVAKRDFEIPDHEPRGKVPLVETGTRAGRKVRLGHHEPGKFLGRCGLGVGVERCHGAHVVGQPIEIERHLGGLGRHQVQAPPLGAKLLEPV